MKLATITLTPETVEDQLARYAGHGDRASTAIRTALTALQQGLMVVDLRTVFHESMLEPVDTDRPASSTSRWGGGRISRTTPSVALAPVTRSRRPVRLTVRGSGELRFRSGLWSLRVPQDVRQSEGVRVLDRWEDQVPEIPPYIETRPRDLVLWEASWSAVPRREFDPALLEHVHGWLFLVREVWDLTEVERGVLT
jgi:hypothetical protein